ncbi:hypothetical protein HZH68_001851 [Vespula germanica]|uniref:Uncharacterized protein n=1 Tax=Vespula germanica TaxID=30212 RepID=A0A834KV14_VESGE|nr:hypothetical protein HZH68_001851 [Vespula germanica]
MSEVEGVDGGAFLQQNLMQQPPSGGTWVGNTCDIWKSMSKLYLKSITKLYIYNHIAQQSLVHLQFSEKPETPEAERHLERECRVESPLARGSPYAATSTWWDLDTTGRVSRCLKPTVWTVEHSVSGVVSPHHHFAEKLEAPEAERHLGSWILE